MINILPLWNRYESPLDSHSRKHFSLSVTVRKRVYMCTFVNIHEYLSGSQRLISSYSTRDFLPVPFSLASSFISLISPHARPSEHTFFLLFFHAWLRRMTGDANLVLSRKMLPLIASREATLPPPPFDSPAGELRQNHVTRQICRNGCAKSEAALLIRENEDIHTWLNKKWLVPLMDRNRGKIYGNDIG